MVAPEAAARAVRRLKISGSSSMAIEMREGAMILELLFEAPAPEPEPEPEEVEAGADVEEETAGEAGWLW